MGVVNGLVFYLGKSPAAKNAKQARNLVLADGSLCQFFHRSLLKSQERFKTWVEIPELPMVDMKWTGIGQTAGVALWQREEKIGAASILLNGVEVDQEIQAMEAYFKKCHLSLPANLWQKIANHKRPLLIVIHYDLRSFTDPVIVTAADALANAFFTMFGTSE